MNNESREFFLFCVQPNGKLLGSTQRAHRFVIFVSNSNASSQYFHAKVQLYLDKNSLRIIKTFTRYCGKISEFFFVRFRLLSSSFGHLMSLFSRLWTIHSIIEDKEEKSFYLYVCLIFIVVGHSFHGSNHKSKSEDLIRRLNISLQCMKTTFLVQHYCAMETSEKLWIFSSDLFCLSQFSTRTEDKNHL